MGFARIALDWMAPPVCAVCGQDGVGAPVCDPCRPELPWNVSACPRCAEPRPREVPAALPCGRCLLRAPPVVATVAPLRYAFPVDAMLRSLKFHHKAWVSTAMAHLLVHAVEAFAADCDAIVPMPLHRIRLGLRGYNQAAEIARPLARSLGLPMRHCLTRRRRTRPQSGLDAAARRKNLSNAFVVRGRRLPRKVMLLDDVITTGTTMNEAAATLLAAGIEDVVAVAAARA